MRNKIFPRHVSLRYDGNVQSHGKNNERMVFAFHLGFDGLLIVVLSLVLIINFLRLVPIPEQVFILLSVIALFPVLRSAILALVHRKLTIDLLASIALIFAFLAREWHSAVFINLMLTFARLFDTWTEMRTKNLIAHLLKYRPVTVKLQVEGHIKEVATELVKVGDLVVVGDGERVPIDGSVVTGQASVDESTLTGESEPSTKKIGSKVFASTLVVSGSLLVKTEKIEADSTLKKMIKLVMEASRKKSPTEKVAEKFTTWYIGLTLLGSIVLYFFLHNFSLILAFLLVVCADDIAVAVPLSFSSAIARGARRGILIKGSDVLEKLPKIKFFLTDKTGTLTRGKPKIEDVRIFGHMDKKIFLSLLGSASVNSNHPIDVAMSSYIAQEKIHVDAPDTFHEKSGEGISVSVHKKHIHIGRLEYVKENGVKISNKDALEIQQIKDLGYGVVAVGMGKEFIGFVVLSDELRPFARQLVPMTKKFGVKEWLMLTGDNEKVAKRVTQELAIDQYRANLKPESKLRVIEEYKKKTQGILAMIGDGVNDAPALALADVSFAMGTIGSDAAIEAADVALMNDQLERIPESIILARKTHEIVKQCFIIWAITNAFGLALVFGGILNPSGAAAYNFLTDFIPIFNALRINTLDISIHQENHPNT